MIIVELKQQLLFGLIKNGAYTSLSKWKIEEDRLVGTVTVPLALKV